MFNKKMKTEVWALVGIVVYDYSDTTSDSSIHDSIYRVSNL
jgi:hypothetical protein